MSGADDARWSGLWQLLVVSVGVVLVTAGFAQGIWWANLHNGLLGLAFTLVGAYVSFQRPRHREGLLFLATGLVESVMFLGRQIGHSSNSVTGRCWGWLGVWPLAVSLALATYSVLCFPDGRLPSSRWRPCRCSDRRRHHGVRRAVGMVASRVRLGRRDHHSPDQPGRALTVWSAIAHPAYIGFQVLWVVAVVDRWQRSIGPVRRQLMWLLMASAISLVSLLAGLAVSGSPRLGVLSVALVPVAAGWAIVHGQQVATYSALTWLSRTTRRSADLPSDLARATCEALAADGATLWMGPPAALHPVGVWPPTDNEHQPTSLAVLESSPDQQHRLRSSTTATS